MRPVIIICSILLVGCYSQRKATSQFAKASIAYPEILAKTCATTYPVKTDTIVKGVTQIKLDTLYMGDTYYDTVYSFHRDTVFITKYLPGKTIIQTNFRTDTVYKENTAALDLCAINRDKAIGLLDIKTKEYDKWRAIAKKRFFIILGMGLIIALGLFGFVRKKLTNPLP